MASCFLGLMSVARWRDRHANYCLRSCGLRQQILQVDPETTIACWFKPPHVEDEHKPALLLIHGFGACSAWQWTKQVKPLLKHFRLFLPDLIFFGKSSTSSALRSEVFQAQMIALAMEALHVHNYSVVGVSYGGFVAFRLAHLFPDRVQKVVIVSSGICMTPKDVQGLLVRANVEKASDLLLPRSPDILRTLMRLSFLEAPTHVPSFILQDVIQYLYGENMKEREELLDGVLLGKEDAEPLPTLSQKVLIIWGEHDGIFPLELAYRLQGHLKENTELAIIKNTAHAVQLENPQEFNRLVIKFLLSGDSSGKL